FQSRSSSCSSASFARIASTSAFEIGFAAVAPAAIPADADVVRDEAGGEDDPAAAVTLAACLEPKMADTMLPKTLILSSCVVALRSHGIAGWFVRMSRGAVRRGFRCLPVAG